jgi:hypothetical protein
VDSSIVFGMLAVPVPHAVEGTGLEEAEDRWIFAYQTLELGLEIVEFAHAAIPPLTGLPPSTPDR